MNKYKILILRTKCKIFNIKQKWDKLRDKVEYTLWDKVYILRNSESKWYTKLYIKTLNYILDRMIHK